MKLYLITTYTYAADRSETGYVLSLANGTTFMRSLTRDAHRRELVTSITNRMGSTVRGLTYTYDDLSRPILRNSDSFGYNGHGEVAEAVINGNAESHTYDLIGNSVLVAFQSATNAYVANALNQYTSILCGSASLREPTYNANGDLLTYGQWSFSYDTDSRLLTVSSNGVLLVANAYDCQGRRVSKTTSDSVTTFLYDDWNLIREMVTYTSGGIDTFEYFWGRDLSGTVQGAGGVGGLLYVKRNGTIYIPFADAKGNITVYADSTGTIVAEYVYDAFGRTIVQSGSLANIFRHRFSSKYFDSEPKLYYYGYRSYNSMLMRWLTRDPIAEQGGLNLYGFVRNSPLMHIDPDGEDIYLYTGNNSGNPLNDAVHQTVAVDTWSDGCPPKKTGVRGFSFGYIGEWGWNWPNGKWLGHSSTSLPGYWMVGEIYEAPVVGNVVKTKKTTPKQDKAWLKNMESRVGTKDVYSVGRHNCRAFSQAEFDKAPQKEN